ncbi:hypothetical protein BJX65DRAFT_262788 [Aspergillus insuetus]
MLFSFTQSLLVLLFWTEPDENSWLMTRYRQSFAPTAIPVLYIAAKFAEKVCISHICNKPSRSKCLRVKFPTFSRFYTHPFHPRTFL